MKEDQIIKGITMTLFLRKDNIIEILDNEDWNKADTLEIIKKDTALIKKAINTQRNKALLIEVPNRHLSKEILNHFQEIETGAKARVLLLDSFATRVMGNLYLRLFGGKPNEEGRIVPTKLFTNKEEGVKWLLGQLGENKKELK
jgi:hypothetical protein